MKEFIYLVLVIMLTPIYIIIKVFSTFMEFMFEIVEPMAEIMQKAIDNMAYFWKNVFKRNRIFKIWNRKKGGKRCLKY